MCRPVQSAAVTHEQHPTAKSEKPNCRVTHSDPCRILTNSGQWVHFLWEYYLTCPYFLRATTRLIQKRFLQPSAEKGGARRGEKKQQIASTDWGTSWRQRLGPTWKWARKASGRDCVGGREVEKIWRAWRTQGGKLPSSWACDAWGGGLCRGPGKVKVKHQGRSVEIYEQPEEDMRWRSKGLWVTFQGFASEWMMRIQWVSRVRVSLTQNLLLYITLWPPSLLPCANHEPESVSNSLNRGVKTLPLFFTQAVNIPPTLLYSFHIIH